MTSPNLSDLIERVEAAEEGSQALDWEIHLHDGLDGKGMYGSHPRYSTSLDAALPLVPEGMVWGACSSWGDDNTPYAWVLTQAKPDGTNDIYESRAATPALALVAASLRALQEKDIEHG